MSKLLGNLFNFSHEHSLSGKIKNIIFVWGIDLIWTSLVFVFLTALLDLTTVTNLIQSSCFMSYWKMQQLGSYFGVGALFFFACIMAPIWEEAFFRFFPKSIANFIGDKGHLPMMIFSSIIFGLAHGSVLNLLIQGISGFLLYWLARKNNDYWSSVVAHALWNLSVIFMLPFLVNS